MSALEYLRSDLVKSLENHNRLAEEAVREFALKNGYKASSREEIIKESSDQSYFIYLGKVLKK